MIIFSSNLDEFVMKRVGYLKHQIISGFTHRSVDGQTTQEQLVTIRKHISEDLVSQRSIYLGLVDELQRQDIFIYDFDDLVLDDQEYLKSYFRRKK